jgi:hypothetical protein
MIKYKGNLDKFPLFISFWFSLFSPAKLIDYL